MLNSLYKEKKFLQIRYAYADVTVWLMGDKPGQVQILLAARLGECEV